MADLVTNIIGQDNLSQTVNDAKKSIEDFGNAGKEAGDKIDRQFNNIMKAAIPMQQKLKGLKSILAGMEINGQAGSAQFTRIAQAAGEMKDAIADANEAIGRFSSDSMKIDAVGDAFSVAAGGASTLAGVLGMVGVKSEGVQRMILKVQSALALLNGVQAIANKLNKDSALRQRIKQIMLQQNTREIAKQTTTQTASNAATAANTALTKENTVATGANTAAQEVSTAVTAADTVKQNAWNVAKAVGKALLGDWSGLLLVAAGALVAYGMATDDAADSEKRHTEVLSDSVKYIRDMSDMQQRYSDNLSSILSDQMATYTKLKALWDSLGNNAQLKRDFLDDYKSEIEDTGFAVYDLVDAEKYFNTHTENVIAAIKHRAKMMSYIALMADAYKEAIVAETTPWSYTPASYDNLSEGEKTRLTNYYKEKGGSGQEWRKQINKALPGAISTSITAYADELSAEAKGLVDTWRQQNAVNDKNRKVSLANVSSNYKVSEIMKGMLKEDAEYRRNLQASGLRTPQEAAADRRRQEAARKAEEARKRAEEKRRRQAEQEAKKPNVGSAQWNIDKGNEMLELMNKGKMPRTAGNIAKAFGYIAKGKAMQIVYKEDKEDKKEKPDANTYGANEKKIQEYNDILKNKNITKERQKSLIEERDRLEEINKKLAVQFGWSKEEEEKIKTLVGSLEWYNKEIDKLEEKKNKGHYVNDSIEETNRQLKELKEKRDDLAKKLEIAVDLKEGSVKQLKEKMAKNAKMIEETNDLTLIAKLSFDNDQLQREINNKTRGKVTVEAEIKPSFIQKGSLEDKRESIQNAESRLSQIKSDYQNRLITKEEALAEIKDINDKLAEIGVKPIELNFKLMNLEKIKSDVDSAFASFNSITSGITALANLQDSLDKAKNGWDEFLIVIRTAESVFNSVMSAISVVDSVIKMFSATKQADTAETAKETVAVQSLATAKGEEASATVVQTAANAALAVGVGVLNKLLAMQAVATATAEAAKKGYPAMLATIPTAVASVIASLTTGYGAVQAFSQGGIVGGNSYSGDKILSRLNSSEMVLTRRHQARLFNWIDKGMIGGGGTATVSTVRIKGSDLFIALKNYQSIKNKSKNVNL